MLLLSLLFGGIMCDSSMYLPHVPYIIIRQYSRQLNVQIIAGLCRRRWRPIPSIRHRQYRWIGTAQGTLDRRLSRHRLYPRQYWQGEEDYKTIRGEESHGDRSWLFLVFFDRSDWRYKEIVQWISLPLENVTVIGFPKFRQKNRSAEQAKPSQNFESTFWPKPCVYANDDEVVFYNKEWDVVHARI